LASQLRLCCFAFGASLTLARVALAQPPAVLLLPHSPLTDRHCATWEYPSWRHSEHARRWPWCLQDASVRDLFAEQGHTAAESKAKIDKAFQQLFHGDGQEERLYFETGANANGPLAYITDWANNDARTEGMSYGMMIAVELNKKREFDALWNWANTYMLITDPKTLLSVTLPGQ